MIDTINTCPKSLMAIGILILILIIGLSIVTYLHIEDEQEIPNEK